MYIGSGRKSFLILSPCNLSLASLSAVPLRSLHGISNIVNFLLTSASGVLGVDEPATTHLLIYAAIRTFFRRCYDSPEITLVMVPARSLHARRIPYTNLGTSKVSIFARRDSSISFEYSRKKKGGFTPRTTSSMVDLRIPCLTRLLRDGDSVRLVSFSLIFIITRYLSVSSRVTAIKLNSQNGNCIPCNVLRARRRFANRV